MKLGPLARLFSCIFVLGLVLYGYIDKQNQITELRLQIPVAEQDLDVAQQQAVRLQFELDQLESPLRLMEFARKPEFRHLKHPLEGDILHISISEEELCGKKSGW